MRTVPQNARLALLLEVSSTPKPGNVDRKREYEDLRFEHFVTGAVGTQEGFEMAASGDPLGDAFERAVAGMSQQSGGNTQFGAVLLLMPLVSAASSVSDRGTFDNVTAKRIVEGMTVEDAIGFYRAFDHVSVAVDDPPEGMDDLDVRRGGDAAQALRNQGMTLEDVMEASAPVDGIAREYVDGFNRTFEAATSIADMEGPVTERAASVFLDLLAAEPDTFVVTQHDEETAREVQQRAAAVKNGEESVDDLAAEFIDRKINPGTTADIIAGGLFVALERGLEI